MTFEEWKALKSIRGEDAKKVIRDFERSNPWLAELYEKQRQEEVRQMRQTMTIDYRMERWKAIAALNNDPESFAQRRRREVI